jgi:transposase InsO family protein
VGPFGEVAVEAADGEQGVECISLRARPSLVTATRSRHSVAVCRSMRRRSGPAWPDRAACRRAVFRWLTRYNTRRRHSYCGQQSPIVYEQQHAATLRLAA